MYRISNGGPLGKWFSKLHFHNNQSKMDWRQGSSSVLCKHEAEFKPQSPGPPPKKKTVNTTIFRISHNSFFYFTPMLLNVKRRCKEQEE
jgi:hypothetical protein